MSELASEPSVQRASRMADPSASEVQPMSERSERTMNTADFARAGAERQRGGGMCDYTLETTPTVRRMLTERLPAFEFMSDPLLDRPYRVGKRLCPPSMIGSRRGAVHTGFSTE